jgi:anti-sigma B factor antagonist
VSISINVKPLTDVVVVELKGRITLGEATGKVRDAIRDLVAKGTKKFVLNLKGLEYMDSAGMGELIGVYTTVKNQGGDMKLVGATGRALNLLHVTRLTTLFELYDDEAAAARSFG